jgi:2-C-methyl-D-erythritol 4-phosphate cytidylyltransferase/2-C-methyl-D-erythritol 2,4-cyclodiphosphate synthase
MGASVPKQYLKLAGRPVLEYSIDVLGNHPRIAGLVVVLAADDIYWDPIRCTVPVFTVAGGAERCHSVLNGLTMLRHRANDDDWVLVHDAARPCLHRTDVDKLMQALEDDPVGGLLAIPIVDTLKRAGAGNRVVETVAREGLWRALTPQMFRLGVLTRALGSVIARGLMVTDEAAAVELMGFQPRLVEGRSDNIKVTRREDLVLAEFYLRQAPQIGLRVGQGYDAHRFAEGRPLVLGGVTVPYPKGLAAHSDGDVVIHAMCDALLGASGLGDIGRHFPDSSQEYAGIDSRVLLRRVVSLLRENGLVPSNLDITVVAQAPRLSPYREAMCERLAADLGLPMERVNIKATTTEGMGFAGRGEGIAAYAVALLAETIDA